MSGQYAWIVYQALASDPVVILAVALIMVLAGLVSAAVPARRAVFGGSEHGSIFC
ncbi:MAG TPA: hypothetical protein VHT24_14815 [Pseudacidobacterium sp.]|nr:hypothetical protein [Pseudacidobacterium sp.]